MLKIYASDLITVACSSWCCATVRVPERHRRHMPSLHHTLLSAFVALPVQGVSSATTNA